jgi:uncharacterized membrane protein
MTLEQSVTKSHAGPLPTPEDFAAYDQTLPGCADRIVSMAEREQAHRHVIREGAASVEAREAADIASLQKTGLWLHHAFAFALLIAGTILLIKGVNPAGYAALAAGLLDGLAKNIAGLIRSRENKNSK